MVWIVENGDCSLKVGVAPPNRASYLTPEGKKRHVDMLAPKKLAMWIFLAGCPTYAQLFEKPLGGSSPARRTTAYKICYVKS